MRKYVRFEVKIAAGLLKRMFRFKILSPIRVFLLLVTPLPLCAQSVSVPGDYSTIQAAINAVAPGDTIYVQGSFTENISINKPLTLQGVGSDTARITGAVNSSPTIHIVADSVTLRRLIVRGVKADNSGWRASAAIQAETASKIHIESILAFGESYNRADENYEWEYGSSALLATAVDNLTIKNSHFHGGLSSAKNTYPPAVDIRYSSNVFMSLVQIKGGSNPETAVFPNSWNPGVGGIGLSIKTSSYIYCDSSLVSGGLGPTIGLGNAKGGMGGAGIFVDSSSFVSFTALADTGGPGGNTRTIGNGGYGGHAMQLQNSTDVAIISSTIVGGPTGLADDILNQVSFAGHGIRASNVSRLSVVFSTLVGGNGLTWEEYAPSIGGHGVYLEKTNTSSIASSLIFGGQGTKNAVGGTGLSLLIAQDSRFTECQVTGGSGGMGGEFTLNSGPGGCGIVLDSSAGNLFETCTVAGGSGGFQSLTSQFAPGGHGIKAVRHSVDSVFTSSGVGGAGEPNGLPVFVDGTSVIITGRLSAPTGLTTTTSPGLINLSWDLGIEPNLARYYVYLDTSANASMLIDSVDYPDTTYTVAGLSNGETYYVRIRTANAAGQWSGYSSEVNASPEAQLNAVFTPIDSATGTQPAELTFDKVNILGTVTLSISDTGPALPANRRNASPPKFYELATTASYEDSITIAISYNDSSFINEDSLHLLHYTGGAWKEITTTLDAGANTITGRTPSLSPFTIAEAGNYRPLLTQSVPDTSFSENFSRTFIAYIPGLFSDPDGDTLSYQVSVLGSGIGAELANDSLFLTGETAFYGLLPVVVMASDAEYSVRDTFVVNVSNTVPAPTLSITGSGDHLISLTWSSSGADVASYKIFTGFDGNPSTLVDSTADTTITVSDLINDTTYYFSVIACDSTGTQSNASNVVSTQPFNTAPVITAALRDTLFAEDFGTAFLSTLQHHFADPDSSTLMFSVSALSSGVTAWIGNDSLYVASTANFFGQMSLEVTASDGNLSAKDTLTVTVTPVNDVPVVTTVLPDTMVMEDAGSVFIYRLSDFFYDADQGGLTYSIGSGLSDSLTAWISGDSLYIRVIDNGVGYFNIAVLATDDSGAVAQSMFAVQSTNVNDPPVLLSPLEDVLMAEDQPKSFVAALTGRFFDTDADLLTYDFRYSDSTLATVTLRNDSLFVQPLPDRFGSLSLIVTASDPSEAAASDTMTIFISPVNDPPVLAVAIADTSIEEDAGSVYLYKLSSFFTDPDNVSLQYTLTEGISDSINVSLHGDSLFVQTLLNRTGSFSIGIIARDDSNASAQTSFVLHVLNVNDSPVLVTPVSDVTILEDAGHVFVADLRDRFTDADHDVLTLGFRNLDTSLVDIVLQGDSLFASTRLNRNGTTALVISATDPSNAAATDTFLLTLLPVNDPPVRIRPLRDTVLVQDFSVYRVTGLNQYFSDVDNASLIFTTQVLQTGVLAQTQQDTLTISSVAGFFGTSRVLVRASDGEFSVTDTMDITVDDVTSPIVAIFALAPPALNLIRFGVVTNEDVASVRLVVNGDTIPTTKSHKIYFGDYVAHVEGSITVSAIATDLSGNTGTASRTFNYHRFNRTVVYQSLSLSKTSKQSDVFLLLGQTDAPVLPENWISLTQPVEIIPSSEDIAIQLSWQITPGIYEASKIGLYEWNATTQSWEFLNSRWNGSSLMAPKSGSGIVAVFYNPDQKAVPESFALRQNYPNPFNPSTSIAYDLPEDARVSIVVYNILGAKVSELVDKAQPAGSYVVQWNGKNDRGVSVASGIYFYRIKAGGFIKTRKMLLLK